MNRRKLLAFEMEFYGFTRDEISKKTQYKENTLNAYFAKNGLWYQEYRRWVNDKVKCVEQQIEDLLLANAVEAAQTIVRLMKSGDAHIALKAAGIILDRAGFGKRRDVGVVSIEDDTAERITKFFEERKQQNKSVN